MKNEALKITREHGLTTLESVQLSVTNPRNKLSIIVDSEAVLQAQFAAHDSMEVAVFEATILPTLRPDLPLCGVLQAMLHNCGVQLSVEQITWMNDGGNEPPPRTGGIQGPPTELNENDGHENDDDDVVYSTDRSRIDDTNDDDADDDDQNEDNGADIMDNARGSSSNDETAEVDPQLEKPCLTMLEEIRCMFMTLFTERKKEAQSWTNIPPRVKKKLDAVYECGSKMNVMASGDLHFQVKDKGYYPARRFIVDLMSRSCDCGYWDLAGIPCTHAMAAISHARHTTTEYLPKYFSKEAYLNTYAVMFKPIHDKVTWDPCDRPKLFPPEITKKIGRPKKSRKRAATEPIKKKQIILYLLLLLWWDEPQCQEMCIKVIDSKRIKSPVEEDEVLVIEEDEGIEAEVAKGVIEQEQEAME
ncbi:hypothetical protein WN944_018893 [Citrus x changshan-huyou]|uniref:SWIM-type domain-containing protein n=1 Tax=Citrus x changshan-huyou TaxID=2935761 RepID=A0AAP0LX56_9ROSI